MPSVISVTNLSKVYGSGFKALDNLEAFLLRGETPPDAVKPS